ncbi:cysteine peptidase family C39 domain-containing protein [Collinsella aerofaciens]|uniref:cysteine peptidase family C39 domain-containing protein n=1 Tax=Collinsella aerofaciens TaxID=74426 RepID=UPI003D7C05A3
MLGAVGANKVRGEGIAAGRVPQIMQMEAVECGAACLSMVCAYYDKWLSLEEVRRVCGVGRDGAKASNIARAAQKLGFEVHAYRFEPERLRKKATFPCIVHWNAYHFVVLRGFRGGGALINDPAKGAYTCSLDEFNASFTGICICLQPSETFEPEGSKPSLVRYAAENLKGAQEALAFVALTTLITSAVSLLNPALAQMFINRLLMQQNSQLAAPFFAVLAGICMVQVIASALSDVYLRKVQGKLNVEAASGFLWKALHLPLDFYAQRSTSDVSGRLFTTAGISQNLVTLLGPLAVNAGMIAVYLVIMVCYSPMLAAVGFAATGVNIVGSALVARKRTEISRVQARDAANLSAATFAGIKTVETIKATGAENGFFRQWASYQAQANAQQVRGQNISALLDIVPQAASSIANALVLVLGLLLVMEGQFSVGMVLAFQGYLAQFAAPAQQMIDSLQAFTEMRVDMERVQDVMQAQDDPCFRATQGGACLEQPRGRLELSSVTFGYNTQEKPLIRDFNLLVEPRCSVAIVGASGSGKSTVASLIAGLCQPWSGQITLDEQSIASIPRAMFIGAVSMVSQDAHLVAGSIADNIRLWDESISDEQVQTAARAAAIHDDIMRMEGGYQYQLAERGRNLSGGQRQRIEIARALAKSPRVLILDEATSALDAQTESLVMSNIRKQGITLIIVAHRLSTVRACDQIVVLDHGSAIERGTHDQLMAADGAYASLVRQG